MADLTVRGDTMSRKRKTLDQWIAEALNDPDKAQPCSAIALMYVVNGIPVKEIHTTRLLNGVAWKPVDLANLMFGKAEVYAQDLNGVQHFMLQAFYGTEKPEAFQPFKVNGELGMDQVMQSETPDARGQTSQGMRHIEAMMQMNFQQSSMLHVRMATMFETMANMNIRLMAENADAFEVVKDLMKAQIQQTHEMRMKELDFTRSTNERAALMKIAPALVNTIAGTEVFPQATEDTAIVETLAEHVTPEQIRMLMGMNVIPDKAGGLLMARLDKYMKQKLQNEERLKQLQQESPALNPDPERDAMGG